MLLVNCVCYSCDRVVDVNLCTHDANKIMKLFDLVGYIYTRPISQRCVLSFLRYAFCDGDSGGFSGGFGGGVGGGGGDSGIGGASGIGSGGGIP